MKKIFCHRLIVTGTLLTYLLFGQVVLAQKQKISCVGNSITYGYGLSDAGKQSYPSQLQVLLGTEKWQVENFGSNSRTMLKSGGYSYWDDQRYKDALASNPNIVVIELGTNDSKRWLWDSHNAEFKKDYSAMVKSFSNLSTKPEIWVQLLIPGEKADWDIFNSYIKDKVNPKIKEVALEMGLGLIDLYVELDSNKHAYYQADSVHPTKAGAAVIAMKVEEMILMSKPELKFENGIISGPEGLDYQWYIDGVPVSNDNGGKQKNLIPLQSGLYKVSVKLHENSETRIVSKELNVLVQSSVHDAALDSINVWPNPAIDVIHLRTGIPGAGLNYNITDLAGNIITKGTITNEGDININFLPSGLYFLLTEKGKIKFIKE